MMRTVIRIILLMGICLLCCNGLWGCKGGREAKVGDIEGPAWIWETTSGYYKINYDGTGVTFHWSCDPPGAGHFEDPGVEFAKFIAGAVAVDTIVELRVLVDANEWGPVIKKRDITVKDITGWYVSEINGPLVIDENTSGIFSILAGGDTGITYEWSVDPPDAGIFEEPGSASTKFTAGWVLYDTPSEVGVVVNSDNHEPVFKALDITIINTSGFYVGEITGPDQVNENTSETFSIIASGDSGITYNWTANPPDAGEFETPDAASTQYSAGDVSIDTPVELQVTIDSDSNAPVVKTKWITVIANSPFLWAKSWGDWGNDWVADMAVDTSGNIYVTGEFHGNVDFDPGPGQQIGYSEGASDIFLGKYSSMGELQWVRTWGGHYDDGGRSVALDFSFGVYVTGYYRYSADFHPGWEEVIHYGFGQNDAFLSRFDPGGNYYWAHTWGGIGNDQGSAITTDSDGNINVVGYFEDTVDFDPSASFVSESSSNGGKDAFHSCFMPNSAYIYTRTWGGYYDDSATAVVVNPNNEPLVIGYFQGDVDFDSGVGTEIHSSNGGTDAFLILPWGFGQYAYTWGGPDNDYARCITKDSDDNYYIAGSFGGDADLDPTSGVAMHEAIAQDTAYITSLNDNAEYRWSESWGGSSDGEAFGIATDQDGNVYVTGLFDGMMIIDTGNGPTEYSSPGWCDVFLLRYGGTGNPEWIGTWGGAEGADNGTAVTVYDSGAVYTTGGFGSIVDFDPTPNEWTLESNGMTDAFLSKFMFEDFF